MNDKTFIKKLKKIPAKFDTVYMLGVFGSPVTQKLINYKSRQYKYWYTNERLENLSKYIDKGYFGFDCVCLIKGILWGWSGDSEDSFGGASYLSNGVLDIDADQMIEECKDANADFSHIDPGEAVWIEGHIGIYLGEGKVIECTPNWENGVQITACLNIGEIPGLKGRHWCKHGHLPYIDYSTDSLFWRFIKEVVVFIYQLLKDIFSRKEKPCRRTCVFNPENTDLPNDKPSEMQKHHNDHII